MKDKTRVMNNGWEAIFKEYEMDKHDWRNPFFLTAPQIKAACQHLKETGEREVRSLCAQVNREKRPDLFKQLGLFILPVKNGSYIIIKGEGYVDIPPIKEEAKIYESKLGFRPITFSVGNSEMQHVDYAYAVSMVRDFMEDDSLRLTIRGRKFTPEFSFRVGQFNITAKSVQTEVDAGYEGFDCIVLLEAKNSETTNTIIRQLYYPYRQWKIRTKNAKPISTVFFEKRGKDEYHFWEFVFDDEEDYNSIRLKKSARYKLC